MGDSFDEGYRADGERPVHAVSLDSFTMDSTTVTNEQFGEFVARSGYVTEAERFGSSAVFQGNFTGGNHNVLGRAATAPWWLEVRGACWARPEGPGSDLEGRWGHPVTHVTWNDAAAFATWAGKRLPTEAEWEYAARGGKAGLRFPWGNELNPDGRWLCNIWQGSFPRHDDAEDGFSGTAPASFFFENEFGLTGMIGNVWEWCADWFSPREYARRAGAVVHNPAGPSAGRRRVLRGGSFLCHDSYCYRYRVAARSSNTPDSSSSNVGFRCAR